MVAKDEYNLHTWTKTNTHENMNNAIEIDNLYLLNYSTTSKPITWYNIPYHVLVLSIYERWIFQIV